MAFEYKVIGAPEKPRRKRGARTPSDRVAAAFSDVLGAEAVDGWEYLRTDLVPVEEGGFFSRRREVHRAVMVFRRALSREPRAEPVPSAPARRREEKEELVLMPERRSRRPGRRAEPEIRLAHSSDQRNADDD